MARSQQVPPWTRFVALGDSFTEGLWDQPDPDGPCRGWADQLALALSRRRTAAGLAPLEYANLAVRGRLLRPLLLEQVPPARRMAPDLVSVIGGGNDLLRPDADPDRLAADLEQVVAGLRADGCDVLLSTGMDTRDSPLVRRTRSRTGVFNAHVWTIARRHGAAVLDMWGMRSLRDWRMWDADRIHLTTDGHARIAQGALVALGLEPDDPAWDDPLAPLPAVSRATRLADDSRWLREHAVPWATRRLRGRSSGDARHPKRPDLAPVEAAPDDGPAR